MRRESRPLRQPVFFAAAREPLRPPVFSVEEAAGICVDRHQPGHQPPKAKKPQEYTIARLPLAARQPLVIPPLSRLRFALTPRKLTSPAELGGNYHEGDSKYIITISRSGGGGGGGNRTYTVAVDPEPTIHDRVSYQWQSRNNQNSSWQDISEGVHPSYTYNQNRYFAVS